MRTPQGVRNSAFIAYGIAFGAALLVSYLIHLLFGNAGRGGFVDLNLGGILEILGFVLTFSNVLLLTRQNFKLPISTLLSGGIYAPPPARKFAAQLPTLETYASLEFAEGLAIVAERGKVVGLFDSTTDKTLEWSAVPKASGGIAVTELRGLLSKSPFVVIADGDQVHGVITQEMFIGGFWRGGISR
jgi:hypothetical protein